jgi:lysylphosphatidylglycerol synthetase-like protein (DUF2156 family)
MRGTRYALDDQGRRASVLELVRRHGWNATSFQVLERGFEYWFDGGDACVAYIDTGDAWVAAGAPLCADGRMAEVTQRFLASASARGRRACFFCVEQRFLRYTELSSTPIGEQPIWDPTRWPETLASERGLRSQVRRAATKGVSVRRISADEMVSGPMRSRLETLIWQFLEAKRLPPLAFLVDVQPFDFAIERRTFVAERDHELVGAAITIPVYARNGWFLEDLIRAPFAPNGTAEALVDATMAALAREGARYATLGLAPLAGEVGPFLRVVRRALRPLYDFGGLARFKAKLSPARWEPLYLAYSRGTHAAVAMADGVVALARGDVVGFAIDTLEQAFSGDRR